MLTQPPMVGSEVAKRIFRAGRSDSLASHVVAEIRDSLFAGRLSPGDFLGTEKEIAARFGVSRIVARDALRTLEALGIAQIKMGKGGGARIAAGNPSLFAEALAVQLYLTGVGAAEVMDAQRAAECMAAELAAEHATGAEHARLEELLADAAAKTADTAAFTRSCRDFHMAIAEASHNRVLVVQLASLQYVSWPKENRQVTPKLVKHILDVHRELAGLIQLRDGAAARRLMDEHVRMIRARRVAQPQQPAAHPGTGCC
ncbi:MAG TPA: FCD domain-containing protein [Steroidobacteraceae bacterium]|nr:FCD domain-containing protein [Steroidobacteraceae bacterium]